MTEEGKKCDGHRPPLQEGLRVTEGEGKAEISDGHRPPLQEGLRMTEGEKGRN
jgi:hypothetical protein